MSVNRKANPSSMFQLEPENQAFQDLDNPDDVTV